MVTADIHPIIHWCINWYTVFNIQKSTVSVWHVRCTITLAEAFVKQLIWFFPLKEQSWDLQWKQSNLFLQLSILDQESEFFRKFEMVTADIHPIYLHVRCAFFFSSYSLKNSIGSKCGTPSFSFQIFWAECWHVLNMCLTETRKGTFCANKVRFRQNPQLFSCSQIKSTFYCKH